MIHGIQKFMKFKLLQSKYENLLKFQTPKFIHGVIISTHEMIDEV